MKLQQQSNNLSSPLGNWRGFFSQKSGGAERYFDLNEVRPKGVCAEDGSVAKTLVNDVGSFAETIIMLDFALFEIELILRFILDFVKSDANNAERRWKALEERADNADDICIGMNRLFKKEVFVEWNVVIIDCPNIDAARIKLFTAEAHAGVFGEVNGASFDLLVC